MSKLIYVACPIIGGVKIDRGLLDLVENILLGMGYDVFIPALNNEKELKDTEIWQRDISKINESDFIIAEVTNKSHGVGYEIGYTMVMKKPVIGLLKSKKKSGDISAMISASPNVILIRYKDLNDLKDKLKKFKPQMGNMTVNECSKCGKESLHINGECYSCASSVIGN
ncbi:MAG: nucleoside 2-deoxyribosyltransferase [Candidatus Hodarchaeales archaeon]